MFSCLINDKISRDYLISYDIYRQYLKDNDILLSEEGHMAEKISNVRELGRMRLEKEFDERKRSLNRGIRASIHSQL